MRVCDMKGCLNKAHKMKITYYDTIINVDLCEEHAKKLLSVINKGEYLNTRV